MNDREKIRLSVVIPCYNAEATIGEQLEALTRQSWSYPWEVVVADNGCTDNSMQVVRSYADRLQIRIVDASDRKGQPYASNAGAAGARGEYLLFSDADDVVGDGWLEAMANALTEHAFVACRIDMARLNSESVRAVYANHPQERGLERIWYPPYLYHAGGSTLGIRRFVHEAVGGYDETLAYVNDAEYCFRVQLAGYELHFVPEAVVHVRLRSDPRQQFSQALTWAEHNVKVYKRYSQLTGQRVKHPWRRYLLRWKGLLKRSLQFRRKDRRAGLYWALGWQIGLLKGALKYRVAPVPK